MEKLNVIARNYLDINGLKINYFAEWIGCERTQISKWFHGERQLPEKYIDKVHAFLRGEHL